MNLEKWKKSPDDLEMAVGYVSPKTGEYIVLKPTDKRIVVYLLNRIGFFVEKMGGECYESHDTIATALNLSCKNVGIAARAMIEHGVIVAELKKPEVGKTRWFYSSVNTDTVLWIGTKDRPTLLDKDGNPVGSVVKSYKKPRKEVVVQKQQVEFDEDFDSPF